MTHATSPTAHTALYHPTITILAIQPIRFATPFSAPHRARTDAPGVDSSAAVASRTVSLDNNGNLLHDARTRAYALCTPRRATHVGHRARRARSEEYGGRARIAWERNGGPCAGGAEPWLHGRHQCAAPATLPISGGRTPLEGTIPLRGVTSGGLKQSSLRGPRHALAHPSAWP